MLVCVCVYPFLLRGVRRTLCVQLESGVAKSTWQLELLREHDNGSPLIVFLSSELVGFPTEDG